MYYVSGIGVPILLGYVYGVVPISLCRSGGCGITTDGGGVRFEFEENETGIPSGMYPCKYFGMPSYTPCKLCVWRVLFSHCPSVPASLCYVSFP